jgi:hypothetical protein
MLHRMWDKEPLIPTSYTPRSQQLSISSPPNFYVKECLKHLISPLVPSPRHGPFSMCELTVPTLTYIGLILLFMNFRSAHTSLSTAIFAVSLYIVLLPLATFLLCCLGKANLSYLQVLSIISSSLFGDLLALLVPLMVSHDISMRSHVPFLLAMALFGGLATARVIMVLVVALPVPIMRLLVGTSVAIINLLFLLYLHFAFMHPTFKYGIGAYKY